MLRTRQRYDKEWVMPCAVCRNKFVAREMYSIRVKNIALGYLNKVFICPDCWTKKVASYFGGDVM